MPDFRIIPSVEQLRQRPALQPLEAQFGHEALVAALRAESAALRARLAAGEAGAPADEDAAARALERATAHRLVRQFRGSLRPVINATGVVIHTNLGRAPLADAALARVAELAGGYVNLEYDLDAGARGSRSTHAEALLSRVTGAEAATVANNNAAATMLILAALAQGREVIISRGELVEIGGGFRVPDVMRQSGAILREVGTTNRTRLADYAAAIGDRTALLLRVHRSNFRIEGFTEQPTLEELAALGRQFNVPVAEDLGSGALLPLVAGEATVQDSLGAGLDVVCFSGDKLLGGPQAGIIVGRRELLDRVKAHPLMRACRVDKLTLAALEGTLLEYAAGRARETVPVPRMLSMGVEDIERRTRALAARLDEGWRWEIVDGQSAVGGGSAPGVGIPTRLLAIARPGLSADALEARLRANEPPIVARIQDGRVVLDLRTVMPAEDAVVAQALEAIEG